MLRDADLARLRQLPLRTWALYESPWLTDAGVAQLAGLSLQHLTIGAGPGESKLTSGAVATLAELPLETLWLPNASGIDAAGWAASAAMPARVTGPGIWTKEDCPCPPNTSRSSPLPRPAALRQRRLHLRAPRGAPRRHRWPRA